MDGVSCSPAPHACDSGRPPAAQAGTAAVTVSAGAAQAGSEPGTLENAAARAGLREDRMASRSRTQELSTPMFEKSGEESGKPAQPSQNLLLKPEHEGNAQAVEAGTYILGMA
ncbi:hypothetical protein AV530_000726 [Patagioenas fasciata monilis]|uniref:Uncharacterized protein n=1 Tax=Patagioenas fasciata monilis TaxID=372326 RepID=A0A1V4JF93_PATFA|nr:hypothetical protein AV530_000726 [Patagioenas fasciata monilis]